MPFTIYCCGTSSNSFDAYGDMERPPDEWDAKPEEYEALWQAANDGDEESLGTLRGIWNARRQTVKLRKNYHEGEIVSTLAKNNRGREYADWILIDGPGSGNYQSKMLWTKPGDYSMGNGQKFGLGITENVKHAIAVIKNTPDDSLYQDTVVTDPHNGEEVRRTPARIKRHGLNGDGEQNTSLSSITPQMLQQQIIKMKRTREIPSEVNLIGWSRGAVTCIMIANAIASDKTLKNVKVRIFAVDPVPGGMDQGIYRTMTRLPKCVTQYFGVYARDEVSRGFTPVIPVPHSNGHTNVTLLPMPGMHATVAGNAHIDKESTVQASSETRGPGRITRYWAEECLIRWGTRMQRTAYYSDQQLLQMYEEMLTNDAEFHKMREYSYTGFKQGYRSTYRQVYIEKTGYLSNYWEFGELGKYDDSLEMMTTLKHKTFVNWHHMAVFRRTKKNAWKKLNR